MSTLFLQYPQSGGGGGNTGSQTGVPYVVGPLDGFSPKNSTGGVIGSFSLYLQTADPVFPGLVSSAAQTFAGTKTFLNGVSVSGLVSSGTVQGNVVNATTSMNTPLLTGANFQASATVTAGVNVIASNTVQGLTLAATGLSTGAPVKSAAGGVLSNGSISLTTEVSGRLPEANMASTSAAYLVGTFDSASAKANGATIGTNSLFMQAASATNPGLVSSQSQVFSGVKSFQNVTLIQDGAVASPAIAFASQSASGIYKAGPNLLDVGVAGQQVMEFAVSSGFASVGHNTAAPLSGTNIAYQYSIAVNAPISYLLANTQNGTTAAMFYTLRSSAGNDVSMASYPGNYTTNSYLAFWGQFSANAAMNGLVYSAFFGGGQHKWTIGGASTTTEKMLLTNNSLTLKNGAGRLALTGSTSGTVTVQVADAGGDYNYNLPAACGTSGFFLTSQGGASNAMTWTSGLSNPMTAPGDMIVGSGGGQVARLAGGTAGQVLTYDTTASNSISWQSPAVLNNALVNSAFDYWQQGLVGGVVAGLVSSVSTTLAQWTGSDQWYCIAGVSGSSNWVFTRDVGTLSGSRYSAALLADAISAPGNGFFAVGQVLSNQASLPFYNQRASTAIQLKSRGFINQINIAATTASGESITAQTVIASATFSVTSASFTQLTLTNFLVGTSQGIGGTLGMRTSIVSVSSGSFNNAANGFYLEQGILNLGPTLQPFARQYVEPAAELASCQYFYEAWGTNSSGSARILATGGYMSSNSNSFYAVPLKVTKRVVPAVTLSALGHFAVGAGPNASAISAFASAVGNVDSGVFSCTSGIAVPLYSSTLLYANNPASRLIFDARMV